ISDLLLELLYPGFALLPARSAGRRRRGQLLPDGLQRGAAGRLSELAGCLIEVADLAGDACGRQRPDLGDQCGLGGRPLRLRVGAIACRVSPEPAVATGRLAAHAPFGESTRE